MLWTLAAILFVFWGFGLASSHTMGGFIHLLLLAAISLMIVRASSLVQSQSEKEIP
jgi:hypothetical protein